MLMSNNVFMWSWLFFNWKLFLIQKWKHYKSSRRFGSNEQLKTKQSFDALFFDDNVVEAKWQTKNCYCIKSLELLSHGDWRQPPAKYRQSRLSAQPYFEKWNIAGVCSYPCRYIIRGGVFQYRCRPQCQYVMNAYGVLIVGCWYFVHWASISCQSIEIARWYSETMREGAPALIHVCLQSSTHSRI